jgi:hypothetical protein
MKAQVTPLARFSTRTGNLGRDVTFYLPVVFECYLNWQSNTIFDFR